MKTIVVIVSGTIIISILLFIAVAWILGQINEDFKQDCHAMGGLVVNLRGPDLCVSPDGRIIPIED